MRIGLTEGDSFTRIANAPRLGVSSISRRSLDDFRLTGL